MGFQAPFKRVKTRNDTNVPEVLEDGRILSRRVGAPILMRLVGGQSLALL